MGTLDKILTSEILVKNETTCMIVKIESYKPPMDKTRYDLPLDHQIFMEEKFSYLTVVNQDPMEVIRDIVDKRDKSCEAKLSKEILTHMKNYLIIYKSYLYAWTMWKKILHVYQREKMNQLYGGSIPNIDEVSKLETYKNKVSDRTQTAVDLYNQIHSYQDSINELLSKSGDASSVRAIMKFYGLTYIER